MINSAMDMWALYFFYEIQVGYSNYSHDDSSYPSITNSGLVRTILIEAWIELFLLDVTFPFNGSGQ